MLARSRPMSVVAEIGVLLALAVALALSVNAFRAQGVPWREDWTAKRFEAAAKAGGRIPLDLALVALKTDAALFLDARAPEDFAKGHLPGALNLPFDPVSKELEARVKALPKDRRLVFYCSGASCSLAEELAVYARDFGYKNTLLLVEGYEGWTAAGYPVEAGKP